MKAKEYYDKYKQGLLCLDETEFNKALNGLANDFIAEMQKTAKKRNMKTDCGLLPLIREYNNKWNSLVRLFIKRDGDSPIKENGFYIILCKFVPELKTYVEYCKRGIT